MVRRKRHLDKKPPFDHLHLSEMRLYRLRAGRAAETDRNVCRRQTKECGMSKAANFQTHSPVEGSPWWWAEFKPTVWHSLALPQRQYWLSGWWVCSISESNMFALITITGSCWSCWSCWSTSLLLIVLPAWKTWCWDPTCWHLLQYRVAFQYFLNMDISCQPHNNLPVEDWDWFSWGIIFLYCKSVFSLKGMKLTLHSRRRTRMSQLKVAV